MCGACGFRRAGHQARLDGHELVAALVVGAACGRSRRSPPRAAGPRARPPGARSGRRRWPARSRSSRRSPARRRRRARPRTANRPGRSEATSSPRMKPSSVPMWKNGPDRLRRGRRQRHLSPPSAWPRARAARCRSGRRAPTRDRVVEVERRDHPLAVPGVAHRMEDRVLEEERIAGEVHLGHQAGGERRSEQRRVDVLAATRSGGSPRVGPGLTVMKR